MSRAPTAAVLIVTTELDPHADAVQDELDKRGIDYFRLHPETLLSDYEVVVRIPRVGGWQVHIEHTSGRRLGLPSSGTIGYLRKPQAVRPLPTTQATNAQDFAAAEGTAFVRGIMRMPGMSWFPSPDAIRMASAKLPQLACAQRAGLTIPDTLVTSSPREALAFADSHGGRVVTKRVGAQPVPAEDNLAFFTAAVTSDDLAANAQGVAQSPLVLQEEVAKKFELRIIVIGTQIFACRIDSQEDPRSRLDWRVVDPFVLNHEMVGLPETVELAIRRYVDSQGLTFSVMDFAVTPDDEYVFFENNPNGQWYWIELKTGFPLAAAVADHLLGLCRATTTMPAATRHTG